METSFQYRRVDQVLIDELVSMLGSKQSVVLIGARDLGKNYLLRLLAEELERDPGQLIVKVEFPREPALISAGSIKKCIADAVEQAWNARFQGQSVSATASGDADLLAALGGACLARPSVTLLAGNVDSLPHHQTERLLREARALVQHHGLTVVLTGEEYLNDLVSGHDSEFNCAQHFLIQGYALDLFSRYTQGRHEFRQVKFADAPAAIQALFDAAGGNNLLARAAIWVWLELDDAGCAPGPSPISTEDWIMFLDRIPPFEKCDVNTFQYMAQIIEQMPDQWRLLRSLLNDGQVRALDPAPGTLELAALAVRDPQGLLHFASPIVERFARSYYDDRRLADLYATNGEWEEAMAFYGKLPADQRQRPSGTADRAHVTSVMKALTGALYADSVHKEGLASNDDKSTLVEREREIIKRIKERFRVGCEQVLGFEEVSFWTLQENHWTPLAGEAPTPSTMSLVAAALKSEPYGAVGWRELSQKFSSSLAVLVLPSIRRDHRDAVVVTHGNSQAAVSRERSKLLKNIAADFAVVYGRAISNFGTALRLEAQRAQLQTAADIVTAIGESINNPKETLVQTGRALVKLGYSRVMFSLVDAARTAIHGIVDCTTVGEVYELSATTHFDLKHPSADIQPWVVVNRRHCVVKDWHQQYDPPIQAAVCQASAMGSFVVLPMLIPREAAGPDGQTSEEVFGTIHAERADGMLPSEDEIDDLKHFGRLIAGAMEQSDRLNALLQTLQRDPDPVVIFDREQNIRFANAPAGRRLGIEPSLYKASAGLRLPLKERVIRENIDKVLNTGRHLAQYCQEGIGENAIREVIDIEALADWRTVEKAAPGDDANITVGASLQIRDLTGLSRVLNAVQNVANRTIGLESVIEAVVDCLPLPERCSRARLYLVSPTNPNTLVSIKHQGLAEPWGRIFNQGRVQMSKADTEHPETWRCLNERKSFLFSWRPDEPAHKPFTTKTNLDVIAVHKPRSQHGWKKQGDCWVDLPLLAGNRVIGKLTYDVPADLTPHERDLLEIFAGLLGPLIDAPNAKRQWIEDAADRAISMAAHSIRTKLGSLGGMTRRYANACPGNELVLKNNAIYGAAIEGVTEIVDRIRETLTTIVPKRAVVDVLGMLNDMIKVAETPLSHLAPAAFELDCPEDCHFSLDKHRLETALEELMSNSRVMVAPGEQLLIKLTARVRADADRPQVLVLSVSDNGPGVPEGLLAKVFETFYTNRPYGKPGTGMGLPFVRRVAEAHGGSAGIENEGPGATFVLQIPAPSKQLSS